MHTSSTVMSYRVTSSYHVTRTANQEPELTSPPANQSTEFDLTSQSERSVSTSQPIGASHSIKSANQYTVFLAHVLG